MKSYSVLFLFVFLLAACDEEQVLYEVESPEPIPEVPSAVRPMAAPQGGGEGTLPPPGPAQFDREEAPAPVRDVEMAGVAVPVPEDYDAASPSSAMRVAQYTVPNEAGEPGELVGFFFGADQGGGVLANAQRWFGQFEAPPQQESPLVRFEQGNSMEGLRVTRMTLRGTWSGGMTPMGRAAGETMEEWGMDALIIEGGPMGTLFLRLTGPWDLVEEQSPAMEFMASQAADGQAQELAASGNEEIEIPAGTAADEESRDHEHSDTAQHVAGIHFEVPPGWVAQQPSSQMRLFEYRLPGGADGDGEFVGFYFGPDGGGSVEANLDRWAGQVETSADRFPERGRRTLGDMEVWSVYTEGTYTPTAMGPMAPAPDPESGYALFAAVIEGGGEGPVYWRITGPKELIREERPRIEELVESLGPVND